MFPAVEVESLNHGTTREVSTEPILVLGVLIPEFGI